MPRSVYVAALQTPVTFDPMQNARQIVELVEQLPQGAIAVAPEGGLSGYVDGRDDLAMVRFDDLPIALAELQRAVDSCGVTLFVGTYLSRGTDIANSVVCLSPTGGMVVYEKVNLAQAERGTIRPGSDLITVDVPVAGSGIVRVAPQLCREVRFPEPWRRLAEDGASIFVHLNNAVGHDGEFSPFLAHLQSRAAENQRFLVSANVAARAQRSPSVVIDPTGRVIASVEGDSSGIAAFEIDLDEISNHYLDQRVLARTVERRVP
ncbi:MAG TPA: carbon-nitrogen hydrolase family protein [Gaiellaceae bacterium]|nr:carbon-nitrogen hydrolase family protein [Gaiellaceae bacterium]